MSENQKNTTAEGDSADAVATEVDVDSSPAVDEAVASADAADGADAGQTADEPEATATEEHEEAAESSAEPAGMTVSHAIGVSRPEDKYTSPGSDDARTREQLEQLGVEPDSGRIDPVLLLSLVGVVVLTVAAWIFSTQLFEYAGKRQVEMNYDQAYYPMLSDIREESEALLTEYAALDGDDDGLYRVPVDVAMDIVANDVSLLAAHPSGQPVQRDLPAGLAAADIVRTPPVRPAMDRPTLQLGASTNDLRLDLGVQGSGGTGGAAITNRTPGSVNVVDAAGGTNTLQVPTGTLDGIVDGAATDGDGEPTIVEEAVVDSAGNPVEATNTPPADDPTVNSAGAAPTPGADDPAANVPTNGTNP